MADYTKAPEVHDLLMSIIRRWHPDLLHARFYCMLKDPPQVSKGKVVVAQVKRFPAEMVPECGEHDYLLTYAKVYWEGHSPEQKEYTLDHEASHCFVKEVLNRDDETNEILNAVYGLTGHDWEDFAAVVGRHGLISQELENMAAAVNQMPLPFPEIAADNTRNQGVGEDMESMSRAMRGIA